MPKHLRPVRIHRKWGITCGSWTWLTTREDYHSCPSNWRQDGAKDQYTLNLSLSYSLSLFHSISSLQHKTQLNLTPVDCLSSCLTSVCAITANQTTCTRCILICMLICVRVNRMLIVCEMRRSVWLWWRTSGWKVCVFRFGPSSCSVSPDPPVHFWTFETWTILQMRI